MSNNLSKRYYEKDQTIYYTPIRTKLPIRQINHQIQENRKLELIDAFSYIAGNECGCFKFENGTYTQRHDHSSPQSDSDHVHVQM